jgi:exosortase/archaeosortase family protein
MKNYFKNQGFKDVILKGILFVFIIVMTQKLVQWILVDTQVFKQYLDIPDLFQIGKGVIAISITNALIFGVVVFMILTFKHLLELKKFDFETKQLWFVIPAVFFFLLHYYLKFSINQNLDFFSQTPLFWAIIKVFIQILYGASVFLAIFGFKFTKYFFKKFGRETIIVILTTVGFFVLMMLVQNLWTYFSSAISEIIYRVFSIFFNDVTYQPFVASFRMTEGGGPLLGIGNFRAIVGKPCSGIDSLLLFTSLYALIFALDYKRLKKRSAIAAYFIGIIGMFLTNVLRILLLFIVGAYVDAKFAIGLFHTNVGWILFIVYFFIYWKIASKFIYNDKSFKTKDDNKLKRNKVRSK